MTFLGLPLSKLSYAPSDKEYPQTVGTVGGIKDLLIHWNYDNYTRHRPCVQIWPSQEFLNRTFEEGHFPPSR